MGEDFFLPIPGIHILAADFPAADFPAADFPATDLVSGMSGSNNSLP
jgi:hypothetical protein